MHMTSNTATIDATKWFSENSLGKKAAVYHLLINEKMIAARIADELGKNKATISRWIRTLIKEQYIIQSNKFIDHQKEMEQVRPGSVSLRFKAYKKGPRSKEMEQTIHKLQSQMGVHRDTPLWSALPGGVEPRIDIHRIDWNLPINTEGPRGGQPHEQSLESWARMGVVPSGKEIRGWIYFAAPDIESAIGPWRVRFRRKVSKDEDGNPVYGKFCAPHPVRITLPNRYIITPEEAMDSSEIKKRISDALFHVMSELSKKYGWSLGLPKQKNSQMFEAGVLRYDPKLAELVKKRRKSGEPRMLPVADGLTIDGSHDLLDEGIVHLDAETTEQAAMQAQPVLVMDHIFKQMTEMAETNAKIANESIETIEETGVNATNRIAENIQSDMMNLVERMHNTFEERFNQHLEEFFEAQQLRVNRAIERFEARLRGQRITNDEGQMSITDFFDTDENLR